MSKRHMVALYAALAIAIVGIVLSWSVISEQQERIAGLEERQVAINDWANSIEGWAEVVDEYFVSQSADTDSNQRRIAGLEERQVAINDWANYIDEQLQSGSTEDRRRISAVESRIASLQRTSTEDRRRVSAVESRIASLQRASTEDRRRLSAVESRTTVRAPQPSQPAVSPELVEILTVFAEWTEGIDQWRRSVDYQLRCAVSATVIKDIIAVLTGDFTKVQRLTQHLAELTVTC